MVTQSDTLSLRARSRPNISGRKEQSGGINLAERKIYVRTNYTPSSSCPWVIFAARLSQHETGGVEPLQSKLLSTNFSSSMPSWTHLIRFVAAEDAQPHLGQLCDTSRDVGLDTIDGRETKAFLIVGGIFDGEITETVLTVKHVRVHISRAILSGAHRRL
jgi:hypothetical protein